MLDNDRDGNEFPIAYLITIRTFGTWLHGDERGSVDRHGQNIYGSPRIKPNSNLKKLMQEEMKSPPFVLDKLQRIAVDIEIREVCRLRDYILRALNVRTNHFHAVVSAQLKPELIITAFKSNSTRALREQHLVDADTSVWSRGKSRRYLWKPRSVAYAIDYTLNQQGNDLVDFDLWLEKQKLDE